MAISHHPCSRTKHTLGKLARARRQKHLCFGGKNEQTGHGITVRVLISIFSGSKYVSSLNALPKGLLGGKCGAFPFGC
jgi:hypothetical protein